MSARALVQESSAGGRAARRRVGVAVTLTLLVGSASQASAAGPSIYQDHTYSTAGGAASADKPQSKLWYNAGAWWALMLNAAGSVNVHELQADHTWRDTGTVVDPRATSTGDALWSGGTLYVASRTGGSAGSVRVRRFSFSPTTRQYAPVGDPYSFGGGGTESVTIDKDTTGALWLTFTRSSQVFVAHTTDASQTTWSAPFRISGADTAVSADDISAVVAFDGKIGVLWSDQASNATRFAYHLDGTATTTWAVETVLSGTGLADDHLNIKSLQGDDQGRLYAAVKTSLTASTDPLTLVLTRTANGTWSAAPTSTVADGLTRPQIALDKTNRVLYVMQSTENGGSVYYKTAPLSDRPSFSTGTGAPFIRWSGARINDVSTTKDPVTSTTGLVAIATDQFAKRYYHAEVPIAAASRQVVLSPNADTKVKEAAPSTVYGSSTTLQADAAESTVPSAVNSYVRFTVPALAAGETITGAKLSLQVSNGTTNGPALWSTGTDWSESGTTWSTGRPARTGSVPVGNFGSVGTGRIATAVTGLPASGEFSLELAPESNDGMETASRESTTTTARPQLILTVTKS